MSSLVLLPDFLRLIRGRAPARRVAPRTRGAWCPTQAIRTRIGSVKNTRKITSAMSRIAAARLVKAQQAALAARPYGERLEEVVRALRNAVREDRVAPIPRRNPWPSSPASLAS